MSELVRLMEGEARTTSLIVAEHFGKEHRHVMRAIGNLLKDDGDLEPNFGRMIAAVPTGKGASRPSPYFSIDRDGFMLLVMGFTGAAALKVKRAFVAAFNRMEAIVRESARTPALQKGVSKLLEQPLFGSAEARDAGHLAVAMVRRMSRMAGEKAALALWRDFGLPVPDVAKKALEALEHAPEPVTERPRATVWDWAQACGVAVSFTETAQKYALWQDYQAWAIARNMRFLEPSPFHSQLYQLLGVEGRSGVVPVSIARPTLPPEA